jgi:integrase
LAKRVPPLTSAQVLNLKPDPSKTVELVDGAVPGLRLRVTPNGTRTWSLNMRASGVMRRFDVGSGLGLSDARKRATELRRRIQDGADPTAERRAVRGRAKAAEKGVGTFGALIEDYFAAGPGAGLRSKQEQLRRLRFVFADHLPRPAVELDGVALQFSVDAHPAKTAAGRAVAYLSPILKWAAKRKLVQAAFDLEKPHTTAEDDEKEVGQRVLTPDELRQILPHLTDPHGQCCRFMLLTGARRREATEATWDEIDLDAGVWTVRAGRRKDTRSRTRRKQLPALSHVIPLPRQAVEFLGAIREAEEDRRRRDDTVAPLRPEDLVFVGERGARLQNWDRGIKSLSTAAGVSGWSAHTLRRTAATLAADLGAEPHVVSVILGHKNIGGQLTATYSKSRYRAEHAVALQRLADYVDAIESGQSNIAALRRA